MLHFQSRRYFIIFHDFYCFFLILKYPLQVKKALIKPRGTVSVTVTEPMCGNIPLYLIQTAVSNFLFLIFTSLALLIHIIDYYDDFIVISQSTKNILLVSKIVSHLLLFQKIESFFLSISFHLFCIFNFILSIFFFFVNPRSSFKVDMNMNYKIEKKIVFVKF